MNKSSYYVLGFITGVILTGVVVLFGVDIGARLVLGF